MQTEPRPYDLRHSGITLSLNAGGPAPEVARRAGRDVAVLLRVYAGCVDGYEQLWNSGSMRHSAMTPPPEPCFAVVS